MPRFAGTLKAICTVSDFRNFRELIDYCARAYQDKAAFIIKEAASPDSQEHSSSASKREPVYTHISYTDLLSNVRSLGTSLIRLGWHHKRIALIGINSYEWMLAYLSVLSVGGTIIPLDKGLPYEEFELSVTRSRADIVFYGQGYEDFINRLSSASPDLHTVSLEALRFTESLEASDTNAWNEINIDPDRPSVYIFTSGTTSNTKAVMLSQRNILSNVHDLASTEDIRRTDVNIAFLPYHHTFGATGQILMLRLGATTVFCDGLKYIQKNLAEYGVSVFIGVPLIIESMYKRIMAAARKNGLERKLRIATRVSSLLLKLGIDIRRKLFHSVIDQLGGKLRLVITGAAAVSPDVVTGMTAMGIETIQGYGMTEASPVIAAENMKSRKAGSIGKVMPSVRAMTIDRNEEGVGELLAQGPNIMLGYMDDEENTSLILQGGWLYTGDLAYIDDDGFIFLRGRKKNVIVLKNGKNIYPEEIEKLIDELPYVSESMVYAQPKRQAGEHGAATEEDDLVIAAKIYCEGKSPEEIRTQAESDLEAINAILPKYKRVHRLIISEKPMVKTTTGKIKRYQEMSYSNMK